MDINSLNQLYGSAVSTIIDIMGGPPAFWPPFMPDPRSFVMDWVRQHPDQAERVARQVRSLLKQYEDAGLL